MGRVVTRRVSVGRVVTRRVSVGRVVTRRVSVGRVVTRRTVVGRVWSPEGLLWEGWSPEGSVWEGWSPEGSVWEGWSPEGSVWEGWSPEGPVWEGQLPAEGADPGVIEQVEVVVRASEEGGHLAQPALRDHQHVARGQRQLIQDGASKARACVLTLVFVDVGDGPRGLHEGVRELGPAQL